ncbi:MAG: putative sulfate/molybdate transporter [Desulfobacterales bacterium]|nr:putative sulfate/molybdate transporter [Desulfobacterales bacterium]
MQARYRFDRMEVAGSLGDLGTLLPMSIGMILINGLNPTGIFFSIGLFYVLSGLYFGIPVSVQPMKIISAYAIATAMTPAQITASAGIMGVVLLLVGLTNATAVIEKFTPKAVVRGVQLSTGVLLMAQGVNFMAGTTKFQVLRQLAEPYLHVQSIGLIPVGLLIGIAGGVLTLLLLDNRKVPAGLFILVSGLGIGALFGTHEGFGQLKIGFYPPHLMPLGFPGRVDFSFALFALVIPQLPMTFGNAVVANADLSREYFGQQARKASYRALAVSMGLSNLLSFLLGGIPLCHGAGGLAAHYRFGARSAGSNLIIGGLFLVLALVLGVHALSIVYLIPMAVWGVLLLFAGSQLALTALETQTRKELFVALIILGITLASNLAIGFIAGIGVAFGMKSEKLTV